MDFARKINIAKGLVFIYLVIFPFGQILRVNIALGGAILPVHLIEVILGVLVLVSIPERLKLPKITIWFIPFLILSIFSVTLFASTANELTLKSFLYLARLSLHFCLFVVAYNLIRKKAIARKDLVGSLVLASCAVAFFGWVQYFLYPDLRPLAEWGWDDHFYRLVSTFLDPGFTAVILVFGFLASLNFHLSSKKKSYFVICVFLLITILFTYSRAGYVALLVGTVVALGNKISKVFAVLGVVFILAFVFLPRPGGEGVKLTRTASILARMENYTQTFTIFSKNPLFGVGYNNLCMVKKEIVSNLVTDSHSCSGSDSSLLLILATTGVLGLFVFMKFIYKTTVNDGGIYRNIYLASGASLLVHSVFVNSLFYPWVMGWMFLLLATSLKE